MKGVHAEEMQRGTNAPEIGGTELFLPGSDVV